MNTRIAGIVDVFSNRDFAIFTAGNALALIGLWVQRLAVGWLAWHLTESGFWLGAVAFADLFPVVVVGPFAGVLADRVDRRRIILICKFLHLTQAVSLAVLVGLGWARIEVVFGLTLFAGTVVGLQQAARLAIVPSMVRGQNLGQAVAINSVIFNLARFVGPALAGMLITGPGVTVAFAAAAGGHLAVVLAILAIRPDPPQDLKHRGVLQEIWDGIRYTFGHKALAPLLILAAIGSLLSRPVFELLPGFADQVFGRGAGGLAILTSAVGAGAIVAGIWLAQRPGGVGGLTRITLVYFILMGVLSAAFGLTSWFWLGVLLMAMCGGAMVATGTGTQTLVQTSVAAHMRGRVLSIWGIVIRGGPAIGALMMGSLAEGWGFGIPVALGGLICVLIGGWVYLRRQSDLVRLLEGGEAAVPEKADDRGAS